MKYTTVAFDLDGTLLDTLTDLKNGLNATLKECGFPYHYSNDDVKPFLGLGADYFIKMATKKPVDTPLDEVMPILEVYGKYYSANQGITTAPYPGIVDLLLELKKRGVTLIVYTNKPHSIALSIVKDKLPDVFSFVQGHEIDSPVKPDPTVMNKIIADLKIDKSKMIYIGDSDYDIFLARNIGVDVASVTYGFQSREHLLKTKPDYICDSTSELKKILIEEGE